MKFSENSSLDIDGNIDQIPKNCQHLKKGYAEAQFWGEFEQ